MTRSWGQGASIGSIYKVSPDDFSRVGNCWMKGRLKDGDLILCIEHSGDHFFDYVLIIPYANGMRAALGSQFGAYTLGEEIKNLPSRDFHLLMAGEFLQNDSGPEPVEKDEK
jgi:hypothetical protein